MGIKAIRYANEISVFLISTVWARFSNEFFRHVDHSSKKKGKEMSKMWQRSYRKEKKKRTEAHCTRLIEFPIFKYA